MPIRRRWLSSIFRTLRLDIPNLFFPAQRIKTKVIESNVTCWLWIVGYQPKPKAKLLSTKNCDFYCPIKKTLANSNFYHVWIGKITFYSIQKYFASTVLSNRAWFGPKSQNHPKKKPLGWIENPLLKSFLLWFYWISGEDFAIGSFL